MGPVVDVPRDFLCDKAGKRQEGDREKRAGDEAVDILNEKYMNGLAKIEQGEVVT